MRSKGLGYRHWVGEHLLPELPGLLLSTEQLSSAHKNSGTTGPTFTQAQGLDLELDLDVVLEERQQHPKGTKVVYQWEMFSSTTPRHPVFSSTVRILPTPSPPPPSHQREQHISTSLATHQCVLEG